MADPQVQFPSRPRFAFIDGLRGLAALAVAALHTLIVPVQDISPTAGAIVRRGKWGVFVFFVISGFVITHSLARSYVTPRLAARFLIRRMARLDPPYWASMFVTIVVAVAASRVLPGHSFRAPSAGALAAHVLYLQYIIGIPSLSDVYWTLCFEIQFYLLLVLLIGLKQRLEPRFSEGVSFALVLCPTLLASFLFASHFLPVPRGSCFEYWYAFAAGVAASRVAAGRGPGALMVTMGVALAIVAITRTAEGVVIAATAGSIWAGHAMGRLDSWLAGPVFQYLGRISYSLYLIHWTIGGHIANLFNHYASANLVSRLATAVGGLLIAVLSADVFWRVVERPSMEFSRWLALQTRKSTVGLAIEP